VVITDGADTDSVHLLDDIVLALRESQVQLFMIGYFSDREREMFFKRDRRGKLVPGEYLQSVFVRPARESGGASFFPESDQGLQLAAEQISRDLRTQYSLGYYPTNSTPDDRYRRIEVRLRKPAGLIVRARQGYILKNTVPSTSTER
jgi:Ca-activated chloride channel family protein